MYKQPELHNTDNKVVGNKARPVVNESNKYQKRESLNYFDPSTVDPMVEDDFFNLACIPTYIPSTTMNQSLGQIYRMVCDDSSLQKAIPKYELLRLRKRMYLLMQRYITFFRFTHIVYLLNSSF